MYSKALDLKTDCSFPKREEYCFEWVVDHCSSSNIHVSFAFALLSELDKKRISSAPNTFRWFKNRSNSHFPCLPASHTTDLVLWTAHFFVVFKVVSFSFLLGTGNTRTVYIFTTLYVFTTIITSDGRAKDSRIHQRTANEPNGTKVTIYPHVARRRPRRVRVAVASPYLSFIFLNFIFSSGRLSSDELSLNISLSWAPGSSVPNLAEALFCYYFRHPFYWCLVVLGSL